MITRKMQFTPIELIDLIKIYLPPYKPQALIIAFIYKEKVQPPFWTHPQGKIPLQVSQMFLAEKDYREELHINPEHCVGGSGTRFTCPPGDSLGESFTLCVSGFKTLYISRLTLRTQTKSPSTALIRLDTYRLTFGFKWNPSEDETRGHKINFISDQHTDCIKILKFLRLRYLLPDEWEKKLRSLYFID